MSELIVIKKSEDIQKVNDFVYALPIDGTYEVVIRKSKKDRSNLQRRLQWKWYCEIAKAWGWEPKAVRDHYMKKFAIAIFYRDDINDSANSIDVINSLKSLGMRGEYDQLVKCFVENITSNSFKVGQNHEYMEQIDRDATQKGVGLTIPGEFKNVYKRGE